MRAYLDHAATTPVLACAVEAMLEQYRRTGNASALHAEGRAARRVVEESRETIAECLQVRPSDVILTSGGTESDNLAIKGLWWSRVAADPRRRRILACRVEHHAVLDPVDWLHEQEGATLDWLDVDRLGRVQPDQLVDLLRRDPTSVALVTVMWANNEVGTIQPIEQVAAVCRDFAVPLHVDAVQAVGAIPVDAMAATTMAISGHKLGGPTGVGALVLQRDVALTPLTHGGGQERNVRSGTYDVPAIAGFAAAMRQAMSDRAQRVGRVTSLRDKLLSRVLQAVPEAILNGAPPGEGRLPGNAHISFPGCEGDALLMLLDAAGVAVSTGSACSAGVPEPSHVLLAMGIDPVLARSSLRLTLGHTSTVADIDALLDALPAAVDRARRAGQIRVSSGMAAATRGVG